MLNLHRKLKHKDLFEEAGPTMEDLMKMNAEEVSPLTAEGGEGEI